MNSGHPHGLHSPFMAGLYMLVLCLVVELRARFKVALKTCVNAELCRKRLLGPMVVV